MQTITELLDRLRTISNLPQEIKLPLSLSTAVMTERFEMIFLAKGTTFTEEEVQHIVHALGVLLVANRNLRLYATELADMVRLLRDDMKDTEGKVKELLALTRREEYR